MHAVPHRRIWLLERLKLHRHVVEMKEPAVERERATGQAFEDEVERLRIDILRLRRVLPVLNEFLRHRAAAEADLEPPADQLIEHANLLDHSQRVIERQYVDKLAEARTPCAMYVS